MDRAEDFRLSARKRPAKTFTNRRIVKKVFGNDFIKDLEIPCFIDDYNHYIRGVYLENQYKEVYETYKTTYRTWWPLFYWLIDVAYINAYRLYILHATSTRPLTHLQFRTKLYYKLLKSSSCYWVNRLKHWLRWRVISLLQH